MRTFAELEAAVDADGRIDAVRMRLIDNVGAYLRAPEPGCLFRPLGNQVGPYAFRNIEVDAYAVMTNKSPTGTNRGYGCQQRYFGLERLGEERAATGGRAMGSERAPDRGRVGARGRAVECAAEMAPPASANKATETRRGRMFARTIRCSSLRN